MEDRGSQLSSIFENLKNSHTHHHPHTRAAKNKWSGNWGSWENNVAKAELCRPFMQLKHGHVGFYVFNNFILAFSPAHQKGLTMKAFLKASSLHQRCYPKNQRRDNSATVCNSSMGRLFLCIYFFTLFLVGVLNFFYAWCMIHDA